MYGVCVWCDVSESVYACMCGVYDVCVCVLSVCVSVCVCGVSVSVFATVYKDNTVHRGQPPGTILSICLVKAGSLLFLQFYSKLSQPS